MSQAGLAKASGISRRMIVSVENGEANISLSSLDKLAAAIGVDFVELVRDPARESRGDINEVTWRGKSTDSFAALLCAAPASVEAQMWRWSLGPGERYDAEPDPQGWHEMIFVIEGVLDLELAEGRRRHAAGSYALHSTAQSYAFVNAGPGTVRFIATIVS